MYVNVNGFMNKLYMSAWLLVVDELAKCSVEDEYTGPYVIPQTHTELVFIRCFFLSMLMNNHGSILNYVVHVAYTQVYGRHSLAAGLESVGQFTG